MLSGALRGKIAHNALALYAVQGLNFLTPLIVLPYLLRVLSPEAYGSIAFAQAVMGYAIIVTDFGFTLTAARDVAVARDDPERLARIYWTTMAAKGILLLVSLVSIAIAVLVVPRLRQDWSVFAVCGLLVVGSALFPTWYFQGLERLREVAIVQAVAKCAITAMVFLLVRTPADKLIAAFLMSAPQLAGFAAAMILRLPTGPDRFHRPRLVEIRELLRTSLHMFLATASTSLYLHTNIFVLGLMAGERSVAYYSLGNRLVIAIQSLTTPVTQAVFPRTSFLFSVDPEAGWRLVRRVCTLVLPAIGLGCVLMVAAAPLIVHLFGGAQYGASVSIMRIMAPVPLLVTVAAILAQIVMVNLGLTASLLRIYLSVGVLNLATLPLLIHFAGANGAALALTLSEGLGPLLMLWVLRRRGVLPSRANGGTRTVSAASEEKAAS